MLLVGLAMMTILAACQNDDGLSGVNNGENNEFVPIQLTETETRAASQSNDFAFRLFKALEAAPAVSARPQNFVSPLSASFALSMLANGAEGQTKQELLDALGFGSLTMDEINSYNEKLATKLAGLDKRSIVRMANSVWTNEGFPVLDTYQATLAQYYAAEAYTVDMRAPSTLDVINAWCADKTENLIPKFLDKTPEDLQVLLLNALYFKGEWETPFDAAKTVEGDFRNADGSTSHPQMMNMREFFPYARGESFGLARLPFGNEAYSLQILLPDEDTTLEECLSSLDKATWDALQNGLYGVDMNLRLPKFKVESENGLMEVLKALGVKQAFMEDEANFSKISPRSLYVGMVQQEVAFGIDEKGAEAAAVTGVGLVGEIALPRPEPEQVDFFVERPFLALLVEKSTGTILFMGRVSVL